MHIISQRLSIRPVTVDDAALLLSLWNDPDFLRFVGDRGVRDLAAARDQIGRLLQEQAGTPWRLLVVTLQQDGNSIGVCSFMKRDELPDPDIGFAFLPAYRRQGYAFEATSATLQHVQQTLALPRLAAIASANNEPSIALLNKLGFRQDRESSADCPDPGRTVRFRLEWTDPQSNPGA